jgi:hypothetical protein
MDPWPEDIQYEILPLSFDLTLDDQVHQSLLLSLKSIVQLESTQ